MAVVETYSGSDSDSEYVPSTSVPRISTTHTPTTTLLSTLHIPQEYAHLDSAETTADVLFKLDEWKMKAQKGLEGLRAKIEELRSRKSEDTEQTQDEKKMGGGGEGTGTEWGECVNDEDVVWNVARFRAWGGHEEWTTEQMSEIADDILTYITSSLTPTSHLTLIQTILSTRIKQLFRSNPHPSLNMSTGRKLPRQAGGPMASQDVYEDQVWKKEVGVARVIEWCVAGIENDAYERMWFLVVPPTMTLLDDYEIRYKIEGMKIVDVMIKNVPPDLLRRTGVTELLFSTLTRSLTFLHSPDTPALLRAAIPTTISLIKHTTKPQSEARFNQLCALLGDGIIGSIWGYGFSDLESITASVEGLPTIVNELKLGTVRYLKALLPQLTHPLLPNPDKRPSTSLQLASLKALSFVVRECAIRIVKWKGVILGPVAKCWVVLIDSGKSGKEVDELKEAMKDICHELVKAVPSAVEDYRKLLQLDMNMFSDLVGDLVSPANEDP